MIDSPLKGPGTTAEGLMDDIHSTADSSNQDWAQKYLLGDNMKLDLYHKDRKQQNINSVKKRRNKNKRAKASKRRNRK